MKLCDFSEDYTNMSYLDNLAYLFANIIEYLLAFTWGLFIYLDFHHAVGQ